MLVRAGDEQSLFFLVDRGTPGCEIVREPGFMHDPYLYKHPEIRLTNCRVPDATAFPQGMRGRENGSQSSA